MLLLRTRMQHLRRRLLVVSPIVACCMLVATASAQEAMLHDGNPALIFRADPGLTITADLVDHDGERALRFPVQHQHFSSKACNGYLYVTRNHIAYDPVYTPEFNKDAFDLGRSDIKEAGVAIETLTHDYIVAIWSTKKRYLFYALFDSGSGKKKPFGKASAEAMYKFIGQSLSDFDNALHDAETLTSSLGQQPKQTSKDSSGKVAAAETRQITKDFQLATYGSRETISLPITQPGQLKISATWGGTQSLAIILNGPVKGHAYARNDGPSPLQLEYFIRPDDVAQGSNWTVSIVNFNKDRVVSGLLSVVTPIPEAQQEQPSQAEQPAESTVASPSVELKEGQTPEEVEKNMGKPQDTITVKESLIYVYPTVKVIFEKGKLVDVQYPENKNPK